MVILNGIAKIFVAALFVLDLGNFILMEFERVYSACTINIDTSYGILSVGDHGSCQFNYKRVTKAM